MLMLRVVPAVGGSHWGIISLTEKLSTVAVIIPVLRRKYMIELDGHAPEKENDPEADVLVHPGTGAGAPPAYIPNIDTTSVFEYVSEI